MSLLVNLGLNSAWTLPAWAMLVLHFVAKITLWWFIGTLAFYVLVIFIMTLALIAVSRAGGEITTGTKENVNPYSSEGYIPTVSAAGVEAPAEDTELASWDDGF